MRAMAEARIRARKRALAMVRLAWELTLTMPQTPQMSAT
jgi:hypothetical protein